MEISALAADRVSSHCSSWEEEKGLVMMLYLVRHGMSLRRRVGMWGRLVDVGLDSAGLGQLEEATLEISRVSDRTVFCSPLLRCIQTARIVCGPQEPIIIVPEFRAYHSGLLENKTETEVRNAHPAYVTASYKERFVSPRFGEESIEEQARRVRIGLMGVLDCETKNCVIVTHYSVINIIAGIVSNELDVKRYAEGLIDVPEGGVVRLSADRVGLDHALAPKAVQNAGSVETTLVRKAG